MISYWTVWMNTEKASNARRVMDRLLGAMGHTPELERFELGTRGGFEAAFRIDHGESEWNDMVIEAIELGQCVAYEWTLHGDIRQQIDGWSSHSAISGVVAIQWSCDLQYG